MNKPKIRFEGYTDAWEQRKVSDLLQERNEQAPMDEEYPLMAFIANQGVAPKGERYDRSALVNDEAGKKYKRTEYGDFIYSSNNLETGSIGLNKYGNACISPVYSIFKPTGKADLDFLGRRFLRKDFINEMVKWRQGVVYGQWKIHESDFLKIEITVPSIDEQKAIGQYLDNLDHRITLHQRKCEQTKKLKKYMLQKMFPQNGELYPEIRFEGFTEAWEQRKLGEICERVTRKNKNNESDLPLTIASQYGLIDQRDFFNKVVAAKDMSNYYLLKKGEFAYNKSYSNGFDYGSIKRLNAYEQGCLSTLYICFGITSDEVESDYLECFFDTLKWYGDLSMICAEGARNHGLLNVDTKGFFDEVTIDLPRSIEEQKKISAYLNALDHLITLHQRKCEQTKKIKKYMLQKMFPQNGELYPEIRFEGFTEAWEQRKLGEICERVTRKNKNNESDLPLTIASQYGLIDQRDFFNKVVAAKDMSNYYLLKKGEFAYNKSYSNGFDYGSIKRLNAYEQGCLSTLYICFGITSDEVESDYLECFFDTLKWYGDLSMICAEGARNHGLLNVDTKGFFDEVTIDLPKSIEEQKKISAYLNALDHLITLHQHKCEELQSIKKYMLQNMFV